MGIEMTPGKRRYLARLKRQEEREFDDRYNELCGPVTVSNTETAPEKSSRGPSERSTLGGGKDADR